MAAQNAQTILLTRLQRSALRKIANGEHSENDPLVSKDDAAAQTAALRKLGIKPEVFASLFAIKCLRWVTFVDGKHYAVLSRLGERLIDVKPNKPMSVSELASTVKASRVLIPEQVLASYIANKRRAWSAWFKREGFIVDADTNMLTKGGRLWHVDVEAGVLKPLTKRERELLKATGQMFASKASSSEPAQTVESEKRTPAARTKTRALHTKISACTSTVESVVADAEAGGKKLTAKEIERVFLSAFVRAMS